MSVPEQITLYLYSLTFLPGQRFRVFIEGACAKRSYLTEDDNTFDQIILASYSRGGR